MPSLTKALFEGGRAAVLEFEFQIELQPGTIGEQFLITDSHCTAGGSNPLHYLP